jgi:DNA polymerase IIIc chi subunit
MAEWTLWATLFTLGMGMAVVALYLICRERLDAINDRIVTLEKEIELARLREEANEKNLSRILDAVMELRQSTAHQLENLRDRLDQLRAENYSQQSVDAA